MVTPWPPAASWCKSPATKPPMPKNFSPPNRRLMSPKKTKQLSQLKRILPPGEVSFENSVLEKHAGDKWFAAHKPDVVVLPRSTKSVSALLRFAHQHRIPVTPRGAGFGYVG